MGAGAGPGRQGTVEQRLAIDIDDRVAEVLREVTTAVMDAITAELEVLRGERKLGPSQPDNFALETSDAALSFFDELKGRLILFGTAGLNFNHNIDFRTGRFGASGFVMYNGGKYRSDDPTAVADTVTVLQNSGTNPVNVLANDSAAPDVAAAAAIYERCRASGVGLPVALGQA